MSKKVYEVVRESCTQGGGFLGSSYDRRSMGIHKRKADAISHKKIFVDNYLLDDGFMDACTRIYDDDLLTTFVEFKASNRITPEMEMVSYSISERWVD